VRRAALGARLVWAAPASVLGLLLAPFFNRRRLRAGVLVCEGAGWPRRLGFRYRAMTLGHVVMCVDDIDDRVLEHELVHVAQYERLGPLLIPAYLLSSLVALARGGDAYRDNWFEAEARRRAGGRARPSVTTSS
jgi:hypothetical protein